MREPSLQLYTGITTCNGTSASRQLEVLALRTSLGAATLLATQSANGEWQGGRTLSSPRMELEQLATATGLANKLYVTGLSSMGHPYLVATQDAHGAWEAGTVLPLPDSSGLIFTSVAASVGTDGNFQVLGLDTHGYTWLAAWQSQSLEWSPGVILDAEIGCEAIAVGMGYGGTILQVVGLVGGQPWLVASQGADHTWTTGYALVNPTTETFDSIQSVLAADGTLFFVGLTSTGHPAVVASQDASGSWMPAWILDPALTLTSLAAGADIGGNTTVVAGTTSGGAAMVVATYKAQSQTWGGSSSLPAPDKPFAGLAVGGGSGSSVQVVGLDAESGYPYQLAWLDSGGIWHTGKRFPEQPPPPQIMTVRVGNFANPDSKTIKPVSANTVPGALIFTDSGELGSLYPSSASHDGESSMSLHYARTRSIDLYAAEGVSLKGADIDLSSGWRDSSLLSLLVGGRANQSKDALRAEMPPAVTTWDGMTFFFWASKDRDRIYAAYTNQSGDFSALIELFARADFEGNGTEPLRAAETLPSPAAYTFGDRIYLLVPSTDYEKIEIHVFHPNEINYSTSDRGRGIFVNYADANPTDQKPGHTTWVRSDRMSIPTRLFRETKPSDGASRPPSIVHVSACLNVALGRQAYLVVSVGFSDKARHDRIVTLDGKTGLPDELSLGKRGVVVIDGGPAISASEPRSLATVPNGNVRAVSRADRSGDTIEIRYLEARASYHDDTKKVVFDSPVWIENPSDPSFTVPDSARTLSGAVAQAVVYAPSYADPDVPPGTDPREVPTLLNAYSVFFTSIHPKSTAASSTSDTVYLTRRLGTARQVPSKMRATSFEDPARDSAGEGPGTGLAVNAIIDGPLPVPNTNVNQLTGGFIGASIARLTVGGTESSSDNFSYQSYYGNGMDIESSFTFAFTANLQSGLRILDGGVSDSITLTTAINAVAKGNFLAGATHGWSKVRTQTAQSNFIATGALVAVDPANPASSTVLAQEASLFATDPTLRMVRFEFQDNNDKLVNSKYTPFTVGLGESEQVVRVVDPLSVKPGLLESYLVPRLNETMAKAYADLPEESKRYFKKSDYDDYFNAVILKNAVLLGSGKPYLEFAWSNAGIYSETSDQVAQKTSSSGWDFSWETKAGVGFDFKQENEVKAGVPFFGTSVVKSSVQLKLQTLYWHKETEQNTHAESGSRSFGLSADLGMLRAGYLPKDVESYSLRVYLLQPSRQWTLEAAMMGASPAQGLNLTSRPWKVMYTVHDIVWIPQTARARS